MSAKQKVVQILRQAGVIGQADGLRMYVELARTHSKREAFRRENPAFALPPVALAYDAFGSLDPFGYRDQGRKHADLFASLIKTHHPAARRICDWGCGPLRVLRHLPGLFPEDTEFVGLDINPETIAWCKTICPKVDFRINSLTPPLPLEDQSVDALYCISVFTHLSEGLHHAFIKELRRVLRPGGLLIATTHGDRYRNRLLPEELLLYNSGELVCRSNVEEGKRMFVSFQSKAFVKQHLLQDFQIIKHDEESTIEGFDQDVWVARKPSGA